MSARETEAGGVFKTLGDLLAASAGRRRRGKISPAAELCEQRCLPAPLGAAPGFYYPAVGRDAVTGFVSDNSAGNTFTVEVDLHVDGTVDYTLTTVYDPFLNLYGFRHDFDSAAIPLTEFDVKLTAVERNAAGQRQTGHTSTQTVMEFQDDIPRLVTVNATRIHLYGVVDHIRIGSGGRYDVEVAVGSPTSDFTVWGQTELDGTFFLTNRAPRDVGVLDLHVRIREKSTSPYLLSAVSKVTYNTNPPTPPPGYVDPNPGFLNRRVSPQGTTDAEALTPHPGPAVDKSLAANASENAAMPLAAETSRATDLVFSNLLPGDEEDSWLSLLS